MNIAELEDKVEEKLLKAIDDAADGGEHYAVSNYREFMHALKVKAGICEIMLGIDK